MATYSERHRSSEDAYECATKLTEENINQSSDTRCRSLHVRAHFRTPTEVLSTKTHTTMEICRNTEQHRFKKATKSQNKNWESSKVDD